jgi:hypothetical protein
VQHAVHANSAIHLSQHFLSIHGSAAKSHRTSHAAQRCMPRLAARGLIGGWEYVGSMASLMYCYSTEPLQPVWVAGKNPRRADTPASTTPAHQTTMKLIKQSQLRRSRSCTKCLSPDTDVLTGLDRDTERRLSIVWTIGSVCSQQRSLGKLDALCTFAAMEDRLAKRLRAVA